MAALSAWIKASRLRTLPLALGCVILGSLIPETIRVFDPLIFGLTLLTTLLLQVLSNLANDYGDFSKGTDNEKRTGPVRMMQSGAITEKEMRSALIFISSLCLLSGLGLLWVAFGRDGFTDALVMLLVGLFAIWAAMRYTLGSKPYGYAGLGDVFVILFFGLVGVAGTAYLQLKDMNMALIGVALSYGFLSAGVLNINNIRDIDNDLACGKITLAARLGRKQAVVYQSVLMLLAFLLQLWYLRTMDVLSIAYVALSAFSILCIITIRVWKLRNEPARLNGMLKALSLGILLHTLIFVIILNLAACVPG